MRVRRMPIHLSSDQVTLMPGKFSPLSLPLPPNFPQSDLGSGADSRWALPQISSFNFKLVRQSYLVFSKFKYVCHALLNIFMCFIDFFMRYRDVLIFFRGQLTRFRKTAPTIRPLRETLRFYPCDKEK